jgi:hypothetical protein
MGTINRGGLLARSMALMVSIAASCGFAGNVKPSDAAKAKAATKEKPIRLPRMSPAAFFRARTRAGRLPRHKNRANCARLAKDARRKSRG